MEMRHFLKRRLTDGMPQAQALVGECGSDSTCNAYDRPHQRGAGCGVKFPNVVQVSTRHDQSMARMKLPQVDNGEHPVVLQNDLGGAQPLCDFAKNASVSHMQFRQIQWSIQWIEERRPRLADTENPQMQGFVERQIDARRIARPNPRLHAGFPRSIDSYHFRRERPLPGRRRTSRDRCISHYCAWYQSITFSPISIVAAATIQSSTVVPN